MWPPSGSTDLRSKLNGGGSRDFVEVDEDQSFEDEDYEFQDAQPRRNVYRGRGGFYTVGFHERDEGQGNDEGFGQVDDDGGYDGGQEQQQVFEDEQWSSSVKDRLGKVPPHRRLGVRGQDGHQYVDHWDTFGGPRGGRGRGRPRGGRGLQRGRGGHHVDHQDFAGTNYFDEQAEDDGIDDTTSSLGPWDQQDSHQHPFFHGRLGNGFSSRGRARGFRGPPRGRSAPPPSRGRGRHSSNQAEEDTRRQSNPVQAEDQNNESSAAEDGLHPQETDPQVKKDDDRAKTTNTTTSGGGAEAATSSGGERHEGSKDQGAKEPGGSSFTTNKSEGPKRDRGRTTTGQDRKDTRNKSSRTSDEPKSRREDPERGPWGHDQPRTTTGRRAHSPPARASNGVGPFGSTRRRRTRSKSRTRQPHRSSRSRSRGRSRSRSRERTTFAREAERHIIDRESSEFIPLCRYCKGDRHHLRDCLQFRALTVPERRHYMLEEEGRRYCCVLCLRFGHDLASCGLIGEICGIYGCMEKHHPLLHRDEMIVDDEEEEDRFSRRERPVWSQPPAARQPSPPRRWPERDQKHRGWNQYEPSREVKGDRPTRGPPSPRIRESRYRQQSPAMDDDFGSRRRKRSPSPARISPPRPRARNWEDQPFSRGHHHHSDAAAACKICGSSGHGTHNCPRDGANAPPPPPPPPPPLRCFFCNSADHRTQDCKRSQSCSNCGSRFHASSDCPTTTASTRREPSKTEGSETSRRGILRGSPPPTYCRTCLAAGLPGVDHGPMDCPQGRRGDVSSKSNLDQASRRPYPLPTPLLPYDNYSRAATPDPPPAPAPAAVGHPPRHQSLRADEQHQQHQLVKPTKSLFAHFCQAMMAKGRSPGVAEHMYTSWRSAGYDENALYEHIQSKGPPKDRIRLRLLLVNELSKAPPGRIPGLVNVSELLDETVDYFMPDAAAKRGSVPKEVQQGGREIHRSRSRSPRPLDDRRSSRDRGLFSSEGLKAAFDHVASFQNFNRVGEQISDKIRRMSRTQLEAFEGRLASLDPMKEYLATRLGSGKVTSKDGLTFVDSVSTIVVKLLAMSDICMYTLRRNVELYGIEMAANTFLDVLNPHKDSFPRGLNPSVVVNILVDFMGGTR